MSELRELSESLAIKAATELNETPENVEHKLQALRTWVLSQKHLRSRTNDQFLIAFLRGSKFSLERAKQKLENFYVHKKKIPEIFYGRNPYDPKVYTIFKLGCLLHLPHPVAADGPRVVMIRPNRFDLTKHTIEDVFIIGSLATDILLINDDNAIIAGYILIMDLRDVSKEVIYQFNPNLARKLVIIANKASPTRMKSFHFLNAPSVFTKFFNMVKSVINEKLRDRIHMHDGNYETLYKYVPRHILTKEYGGDLDDSDWPEEWKQRIEDHADYLIEEETYGVIEDTIPTTKTDLKNEMIDGEFGIDGSFRKLNFD